MVLRGEKRADVALQDEVRLDRPLDGLLDLRVGLVGQVTQPLADLPLPCGQVGEVRVDSRMSDIRRHG